MKQMLLMIIMVLVSSAGDFNLRNKPTSSKEIKCTFYTDKLVQYHNRFKQSIEEGNLYRQSKMQEYTIKKAEFCKDSNLSQN